jgi:hypothetical protein
MRNRLLRLVVAAGCVFFVSPDLDACGDKLIRMGRGLRSRAAHPASILIYMQRDSVVPAAAKDLRLSAALSQAGHRIRAVERENDLESELKSGAYDIVVADASAGAIVQQMQTGPSKPRFLPVFYKPTRAQLADAEKRNLCFLAAPGKTFEVLAEIDHVMAERRKQARPGL